MSELTWIEKFKAMSVLSPFDTNIQMSVNGLW